MNDHYLELFSGESLTVVAHPGSEVVISAIAEGPDGRPEIQPVAQRDRDWRHELLGDSSYHTIGQWGCALSCATMVARLVDPTLTLLSLQDRLRAANGFWHANLNWAALPVVVPGLRFGGIVNWVNGPADPDVVGHWLEKGPLITFVDFKPGGPANMHFVLVTGITDDDLVVIDPWDGYRGELLLRYALEDWTLARAIYGIRPLFVDDATAMDAGAALAFALRQPDQFENWPEPLPEEMR